MNDIFSKLLLITSRVMFSGSLFLAGIFVTNNFNSTNSASFFLFISLFNIFILILVFGSDIAITKQMQEIDISKFLNVTFYLSAILIVICLLIPNKIYLYSAFLSFISIPIIFLAFICRNEERHYKFQFYRNGFFAISILISTLIAIYFKKYSILLFSLGAITFIAFVAVTGLSRNLFTIKSLSPLIAIQQIRNQSRLFFISFISALLFWVDTILADLFFPPEQVAVVGVLSRFSALINMVYLVLLNYYTPKLVQKNKFPQLIKFQLNVIVIGVVYLSAIFIFKGKLLLLFGVEFTKYEFIVNYLLLAHLFNFVFGLFKTKVYLSISQNFYIFLSIISITLYFTIILAFHNTIGLEIIYIAFLISSVCLNVVAFAFYIGKAN